MEKYYNLFTFGFFWFQSLRFNVVATAANVVDVYVALTSHVILQVLVVALVVHYLLMDRQSLYEFQYSYVAKNSLPKMSSQF